MPRVTEFEAPDLGLAPTETGIEATAMAARRVSYAYEQAAEAKQVEGRGLAGALTEALEAGRQYEVHRELNNAAPAWANTTLALDREWHNTHAADPANESNGHAFLQNSVLPAMQNFKQQFFTPEGQEWARKRVDEYTEKMARKTAADGARGAANAFPAKVQESVNSFAMRGHFDGTEENLHSTLDDMHKTVGAMGPGKINDKDWKKADGQVTRAFVYGYMKQNNGEFPKWLDPNFTRPDGSKPNYGQHMDEKTSEQMETFGRTVQSFDHKTAQWAEKEQQAKYQQDFNTDYDQIKKEMRPKSETDSYHMPENFYNRIEALAARPTADLPANRKLIDGLMKQADILLNRSNKPETRAEISHRNLTDITKGIRDGTITDEQQIWDAFNEGKTSTADHNYALKTFEELRQVDGDRMNAAKKRFFDAIAPQIDKSNPIQGTLDKSGKEQMYEFEWMVNQRIQQYRDAKRNPFDLFDPNKPDDFLGNPKFIEPYKKDISESITDYANSFAATGQPPGPLKVPPPPPPPAPAPPGTSITGAKLPPPVEPIVPTPPQPPLSPQQPRLRPGESLQHFDWRTEGRSQGPEPEGAGVITGPGPNINPTFGLIAPRG